MLVSRTVSAMPTSSPLPTCLIVSEARLCLPDIAKLPLVYIDLGDVPNPCQVHGLLTRPPGCHEGAFASEEIETLAVIGMNPPRRHGIKPIYCYGEGASVLLVLSCLACLLEKRAIRLYFSGSCG